MRLLAYGLRGSLRPSLEPSYTVRLCALILLALSLSIVATAQPQFFIVEVKTIGSAGEKIEYMILEWRNGLSVTLPLSGDVKELVIRVDSGTPFKPSSVALDGRNVTPCYDTGVVLIEDFVWINVSKIPFKPRTVTVWFGSSEAKPPIYGISDRGGKVWGYVVESVIINSSVIASLGGSKITVLAKHPITVPASLGNVSFWDIVMIHTRSENLAFLLENLKKAAVEVRVRTLYYTTDLTQANLYIYANVPAACASPAEDYVAAEDVLGRAFPSNPRLLRPESFPLDVNVCTVVVHNDAPFDYVVGGTLVPSGLRVEVRQPPTGSVLVEAFRAGIKVYSFLLYGLPRTLELPSFAYDVKVAVLDAVGERVSNATCLLLGVNTPLRDTCHVIDGECLFSSIPPGNYTLSVIVGGREVGRDFVTIGSSSITETIRVDLFDFDFTVLYPTGEKLVGYNVTLQSGNLKYVAREQNGRARFNDVPIGTYNYTVMKNGVKLASGSLSVEPGRASYAVIASVSKVYIKIVDLFGRPLPNLLVELSGPVQADVRSGDDGVAIIDLPIGEYEVYLRDLGVRSRISVRSGGEYITLSLEEPLRYTAVIIVAVVIVAAMLKVVKNKNRSIEIIDWEEK